MTTSLTLTEDGETQGWTDQQRHLMGWLATPRELRDPPKQQALAVQMGVSPSTLMNWKRRQGFKAQVRAACNQLVADDWLIDIYHAMYRQALEGNVPAARFLFEAAGIMGERAETGAVDRRVQFIIMPAGSTALPELARTADNSEDSEPVVVGVTDTDGHGDGPTNST